MRREESEIFVIAKIIIVYPENHSMESRFDRLSAGSEHMYFFNICRQFFSKKCPGRFSRLRDIVVGYLVLFGKFSRRQRYALGTVHAVASEVDIVPYKEYVYRPDLAAVVVNAVEMIVEI